MNQKHLLRFIKHKLRYVPNEVVTYRDGKHLTLGEVFESLKLTGDKSSPLFSSLFPPLFSSLLFSSPLLSSLHFPSLFLCFLLLSSLLFSSNSFQPTRILSLIWSYVILSYLYVWKFHFLCLYSIDIFVLIYMKTSLFLIWSHLIRTCIQLSRLSYLSHYIITFFLLLLLSPIERNHYISQILLISFMNKIDHYSLWSLYWHLGHACTRHLSQIW